MARGNPDGSPVSPVLIGYTNRNAPTPMNSKRRVLVIGEDAEARTSIIDTLTQGGFEVVGTSHADQPLVAALRERPDLVVVSAGVDPARILEQIRSGAPRDAQAAGRPEPLIPVLVVADGEPAIASVLEHEAVDFIRAPVHRAELLTRVG